MIAELCQQLRITAVQVNEEYGVHESHRDQAVAQALGALGINLHSHLDQLFFRPGSVMTKLGSYFQVYSQFRTVCYQRLHIALSALLRRPAAQAPLSIASDPVPAANLCHLWPAKTVAGLCPRADRRLPERARFPGHTRHHPLVPLPRRRHAVATPVPARRPASHQGEFDSGNSGIVTWINELLWREVYKHILVGYPRVSFRPRVCKKRIWIRGNGYAASSKIPASMSISTNASGHTVSPVNLSS
ncbi:Deoxyribodipyrimidine photo-lyase [Pseudomonas fluorescens]|uniref:Deoxyribodipyrimidine photo-lyase n=1 Tax=Pseudomonas fluorescens TaxID=294 RepID=A0A5E7UZ32_PSEFL|nr:Deoxyribodipyrimidine photo-lyase [Pseudomonas fluorescens]